MARPSRPAHTSAPGFVLETTTPNGRHWSCAHVPPDARTVQDPAETLAVGDLVGVHDPRTGVLEALLRVEEREGARVHLRRVRRRH